MRTALLSIILLLFFAGSSFGQAQMIAHWPLDGNTAEVINGLHGIPSPEGVSWVDDPQLGQVMKLDGVAGVVTLPEQIWTNPADTNTTITCWYNFAGGAPWQRVFSLGKADPAWALMYYCPRDGWADNGLHLTFHPAAPPDIWYDFLGGWNNMDFDTITYNQWYFTAVVIKDYTLKVWLNGSVIVNQDSVYVTPQKIQPAGSINVIGQSHWPDATFNGMIDDFRIYNNALTDTEVLALYEAGNVAVPTVKNGNIKLYGSDGRIMYSNVDESTVRDVSVYSITGSLLYRSDKLTNLPGKSFIPGVYLVRVKQNNELITKKVAVMK